MRSSLCTALVDDTGAVRVLTGRAVQVDSIPPGVESARNKALEAGT